MTDRPKSALELVMERLRQKDAEAGVHEQALTDHQKAAIADARSLHEARVAEARILHENTLLTTLDSAERDKLEGEYRRDLDRLASDRDAKIRTIRESTR